MEKQHSAKPTMTSVNPRSRPTIAVVASYVLTFRLVTLALRLNGMALSLFFEVSCLSSEFQNLYTQYIQYSNPGAKA